MSNVICLNSPGLDPSSTSHPQEHYKGNQSHGCQDNNERQPTCPDLKWRDGLEELHAKETIPALYRIWKVCQNDQRWKKRGAGYLFYLLADELIGEAVSVVEGMQDELEQIEDQLFTEAGPDTLERLFTLKRNILQLRRMVVPQKDVLNKLARNDYQVIEAADHIFIRDVYDHLLQLNNLLYDLVILVGGDRDSYIWSINKRM